MERQDGWQTSRQAKGQTMPFLNFYLAKIINLCIKIL
jgi:hypothetical protein